jgi:hypothetical protein
MRKRLYAGLVGLPVLVVIVIGVLAGPGSADPNLPTVPVHRHWLGDPSLGGAHQIGPDICANPKLQNAFNQFHFTTTIRSFRELARELAHSIRMALRTAIPA